MARVHHLKRFYELLISLEKLLGSAPMLSSCTGKMHLPQRGVYFFREQGENRADTGSSPRIVRVGTHALKAQARSTLWGRLSQHRGSVRSGGGNHRGSIFRLLIGSALIQRDHLEYPTWGKGSSAPPDIRQSEVPLEQQVSKLVGAMSILWLSINDTPGPNSLRGTIERNSIALLSNAGKTSIDPPSKNWLGNFSTSPRVRASGMWNQNHVEESYDPKFLDMLEHLIQNRAC